MKIGTCNYYLDSYGLDGGAKRMASHGYESIDFQLANTDSEYYSAIEEDFLDMMYGIRKTLSKNGITVNQIHGPWRFPAKDSTEDDRAERFGKMTKALVMAKHLGAKYMAVHPLMPYGANSPEDPEEVYRINKNYYTALAKVAEGLGVVVCLENMPFPDFPLSRSEDVLALIKDINRASIKMCFDVGHATILGEPLGDTVRLIGDELRIIHAHDNGGSKDEHLPPYDGIADWADLAEGLFDIGFEGVFSLEAAPVTDADRRDGITEKEIEEKELEMARLARLIAG